MTDRNWQDVARLSIVMPYRVAEAIDAINGLWRDQFGFRLLGVHQQRAVLDLGRPCATPTELSHCIQALCLLLDSITVPEEYGKDLRPLQRLEEFLKQKAPGGLWREALLDLRQMARLRNLYPAHPDPEESIRALRHFGFQYPLENDRIGALWQEVVLRFFGCLLRLTQAVAPEARAVGLLLSSAEAASRGDYDESIMQLEEASRLAPRDSRPHVLLALMRLDQNSWQDAVEAANRAIAIQQDCFEAQMLKVMAQAKLGQYQAAEESCKEAIRIKPDDSDAHMFLALIYFTAGRFSEALDAGKEAVRIDPTNARARQALALAYGALGDMDAARQEFRVLWDLNPALAQELVHLMKSHVRTYRPFP